MAGAKKWHDSKKGNGRREPKRAKRERAAALELAKRRAGSAAALAGQHPARAPRTVRG